MSLSTNNIEAVARDICAKHLSRYGGRDAEHAGYVDRYWHRVAADLEAGLIDAAGHPVPKRCIEDGLAAYRDWCSRHPESRTACM